MASCLIALGSNLGDRHAALEQAVELLRQHPDVELAACSRWHETAAVGGPTEQASFLNGAALLHTSLSPANVLTVLQSIENQLGRQRDVRWGPRVIDLDLLLYERQVLDTDRLQLPHPRMAWRRFVLQPAAEVAADMVHPTIGWTVSRLLEHLDTAANYVALAGSIGVGKSVLAERLAVETSARLVREPLDLKHLATFYADPSSHARQTELEFLRQRTEALAADDTAWTERSVLSLSDFWYDQSAAFARVWLPAAEYPAFRQQWCEARRHVVRPKLLVLLEASADALFDRVQRRGRRCEQHLTAEQLGSIAASIRHEVRETYEGPLLVANADDFDATYRETLAAIEAMR